MKVPLSIFLNGVTPGGVLTVFTGRPLTKPDGPSLILFLHSVSVSVKDKY